MPSVLGKGCSGFSPVFLRCFAVASACRGRVGSYGRTSRGVAVFSLAVFVPSLLAPAGSFRRPHPAVVAPRDALSFLASCATLTCQIPHAGFVPPPGSACSRLLVSGRPRPRYGPLDSPFFTVLATVPSAPPIYKECERPHFITHSRRNQDER